MAMATPKIKSKSDYLKGIRNVAVYVRKSRVSQDQTETETLEKHRRQLLDFAEQNDLEYILFEEIISGTSTERKEFLKMLTLIEAQAFDAIVVIHIDRLGRNELDTIKLKKTLQESDTILIQLDPFDIIDFNNDTDYDKAAFAQFFAEWEARQIKRRLKAGKIRGALQGKAVNPAVPFGYHRNPQTGYLEIVESQAKTFRYIVELLLNGMTTKAICFRLNREGIKSPKGFGWADKVIRNMLIDEVYTGTMIFGKAKYIRRGVKIDKPREEWIIVPNAHPAIIDEDTHNKILNLFNARKRINGQAQLGHHILSGLLKCSSCGSTLHFPKTPRGVWVRKCRHTDEFGNVCKNNDKGVAVRVVTQALAEQLKIKKADLLKLMKDDTTEREVTLKVKRIEAEIAKIDKAIDRVLELYEFGDIDRATFNQRTNDRKAQKEELERQFKTLKSAGSNSTTVKEKVKLIDKVVNAIAEGKDADGLDDEKVAEINKALSELIDRIIYKKPDKNDLTLEFIYL